MKPSRRRLKSRPMDLRHEAQRQMLTRYLILGETAEEIAQHLGRTTRAVRYCIATPEFQTLYAERQKERFQAVDRQMGALLETAVDTLHGLLRHRDWRARDTAVEKILRVHGRYFERLDLVGRVQHHHTGSTPEIVMSDETRAQVRDLLTVWRQQEQPRPTAQLLARNGTPGAEPSDSEN